jgi:hypothetical protein
MTDQFPDATKMVLSPAAQAVLDAFLKDADEDATLRLFQGHLADALRAAADQVVPEDATWHSPREQLRHWPSAAERAGEQGMACVIRRKILTLATELESH